MRVHSIGLSARRAERLAWSYGDRSYGDSALNYSFSRRMVERSETHRNVSAVSVGYGFA